VNQSLTEAFSLDGLGRVMSSTLNGVTNFSATYDASGNLTARSDVGLYAYGDPAHPHAVTQAGSRTYTYDANGNQITRDGASQAWASYNLPLQLAQPIAGTTYVSRFSYGPDRQRWKQVASYANGTETTHYVGGLLEKEQTTSTGITYWRHYVPTPTGHTILVSRTSDATSSGRYLLADHLGGTDTVLDEAGNVALRASYGVFGNRRAADWSAGAPDWSGIANTTRRGYTGHEHLDNLALIHMHGRVYDPGTGRFLSVDPLIGDPGDSQQVNPYAYVGNRPLTSIDPTGQELVCAAVCWSVVGSVFQAVSSLFGPDSPPKPPATALPGQSAQTGVAMCSPGQTSASCAGAIPGGASGRDPIETDDYASENLRELWRDLGYNAINVLVLSAYYDATDAIAAFDQGEYFTAAVLGAMVICDVAKPCQGIAKAGKAASGRTVKQVGEAVEETQGVLQSGQHVNRVWDSRWTPGSDYSGPYGGSYTPGATLPPDAPTAVTTRGLDLPGVMNNAGKAGIYRVTKDIPAVFRTSIGGTAPEIYVAPEHRRFLELIEESITSLPSK
jgi:RHS repeat-associated protein